MQPPCPRPPPSPTTHARCPRPLPVAVSTLSHCLPQLHHQTPTQLAPGPDGKDCILFGAEGFTRDVIQAWCRQCPVRADNAPRQPTEKPSITAIVAVMILAHLQVWRACG